MTDMQAFHKHLDVCAQCANNPFNLCPTGAAILTAKPLSEKHLPSLPELHARTKVLLERK